MIQQRSCAEVAHAEQVRELRDDRRLSAGMSGDWYTTVSAVAERLSYTARSSYASIHDSLSDLTSGIDSTVFNVTSRPAIFAATPPPPPQSQWETLSSWALENKYAIAAITGATGVGAFVIYKAHAKRHKKRRAARTGNASRKEVLVITNFTSSAISKSIALDLERRGFVVFCACQTPLEKHAIENEGHADIRPLLIPQDETPYIAIEKFGSYLNVPAPAYHGGHTMHFAGLILAPPAPQVNGPLEIIETEQMTQAWNSCVRWPTLMIQHLLPLLREHTGRIVFLNEWIIPSLHTPFYAPQVMSAHAVEALSKTVSREVPSLFTIHMRLGTFDLAHHNPSKNAARADVLGWSPSHRAAYSTSYKSCTSRPPTARVRGSPIKELHHAVFDAICDANPSTNITIGAGAKLYQWLANLLPESTLKYLVGVGATNGEADWEVVE